MPESAFIAEQDFQTVRQNRSGYAVTEASPYSQQVSFQSQAAYGEPLTAVSLHRALTATVLTAMQLQNPRNHPFIDGNKRVGFAATYTFLAINGLRITADAQAAYGFIAGLYGANEFTFERLAAWLRENTAPA